MDIEWTALGRMKRGDVIYSEQHYHIWMVLGYSSGGYKLVRISGKEPGNIQHGRLAKLRFYGYKVTRFNKAKYKGK